MVIFKCACVICMKGTIIAQPCLCLVQRNLSAVTTSSASSFIGLCRLVFSLSSPETCSAEDLGLSSARRYHACSDCGSRRQRVSHLGRVKRQEKSTQKTIVVILYKS